MLKSDLCDYSDVYIAVKGEISVASTNNTNRKNKKLTFTNKASFKWSINLFVHKRIWMKVSIAYQQKKKGREIKKNKKKTKEFIYYSSAIGDVYENFGRL